jgi:hypothetical protein
MRKNYSIDLYNNNSFLDKSINTTILTLNNSKFSTDSRYSSRS